MSDLVAFIEARLTEDEAAARAATPGPWTDFGKHPYGVEQLGYDDGHMIAEIHQCGAHEGREAGDAEHMARHDPARVLREVAGKRRVVALAQTQLRFEERYPNPYYTGFGESMLLALAAAWSDHPDYRPEWAPESVVPRS